VNLRENRTYAGISVFVTILTIGILARIWEFGSLPPGMFSDELSVAVDSFSILHFGVDRNLVSFPVFLTSWGEGTSALYAYIVMPFFALLGASPFTFRLPMLISGILTLPLVYLIGEHLRSPALGLASMFVLAISPWHIMLSRWALECNVLPFVFSLGFLAFLKSTQDQRWFTPAMVFMALSLYAYATAFAAIPIFLAFAIPTILASRTVGRRTVLLGLMVFVVLAAPIGAFLVVNTVRLESLHIGAITIPRLPVTPRYETVLSPFAGGLIQALWRNVSILAALLFTQFDSQVFNTIRPYGYMYRYTLPFAVAGAVVLLRNGAVSWRQRLLFLGWLAAALSLGLFQDANINRMNLVFVPLIICLAAFLHWIGEHSQVILGVAVACLLIAFCLFTRDYHGEAYRASLAADFAPGSLPAVAFASRQNDHAICITDDLNYGTVLFVQVMNSEYYPQVLTFHNPGADLRVVAHMYPYTFGLARCPKDPATVYVLRGEMPPGNLLDFSRTQFGDYSVYVPHE
jgi:hypothetical protein